MNETPEGLRKAIERADAETEEYGASNPDYGNVDVDVCRAALLAWEADIARREALERLYSQSRLFFVAKRVLEGALDLGDLRIAVEEHEALHNGR